MPRETEIVIACTRADKHGGEVTRLLLGMTGAAEVHIASRLGEGSGVPMGEEENGVLLGYDIDASRAPSLFLAGNCLVIDVGGSPLSKSLRSACKAKIAADRLDDFAFNGVVIRVGDHVVGLIDDDDEIVLVGRYFASVTVWGYGTPTDSIGVLAEIRALPEFVGLLEQVAREIGPSRVSNVFRL